MKKILALLAVLVVAFMVFACGQTATTPAATTPAATTGASTTAKTTEATTVATTTEATTVATTTTEATTAPVNPGDVYVDLDFDYDNEAIVDKKGNVTCKPVGNAMVDKIEVTHNGLKKEMNGLVIVDADRKSWVECTFTNIKDYAQLNKFVEEMKGWTVEAFYLNAEKKNVQGIVCVTEGNAGKGKQGWGLADNGGHPYFIFGDGNNAWSTTGQSGASSATEFCHVVAVYDATAKTNTVYLNGKAIKSVAAAGFTAADALGKDSTGEKVFNMGNGFFLGADPTVQTAACDYGSANLKIAAVKIYAGALTAEKVVEAYKTTAADFQFEALADGKFIAYVPVNRTAYALNLTTGMPVGTITVPEGTEITIKGGYLYVAESKDGVITAVKEIGAAVANRTVSGGATNINIFAETQPGGYMLKHSSYLIRATGLKSYAMNTNLAYDAFNTVLSEAIGADYATTIGKFGKITFTGVTDEDFEFYLDGDTNNTMYASDIKAEFVYFNYDGSNLSKATGTTWNPLAMNQMELIRYATDMAWGNENGYQTKVWVEAMRTYGGLASVETFEKTWNGTTYQNYNVNAWQNQLIPVQYASALANYNKTITGDVTEAAVKAEFDAAVAALEAAQKKFDDAVAGNASVKALKEAMVAAETALNAAKQAEYEARYKMEYEKAKSKNSAEHIEAEKVWKEAAAVLFSNPTGRNNKVKDADGNETTVYTEVQKAYNDAKAAYDAAIEADATLKALNADLVKDTTIGNNILNGTPEKNEGKTANTATVHYVANTKQTRVDNYHKWAPLYAAFMEKYEEAANVALWTNDQAGDDTSESALYKAFKDIASDNRSLPSYNYFYNAATETYVIFVTSGTQTNACENFNTLNAGNALLSGRNWLKIVTEE